MSRSISRNQRLAIAGSVVAAIMLLGGGAFAQKALPAKSFSGGDAAYVDWAWKNCGLQATSKERGLVETTAKMAGDKFQKSYEQEYNAVIAKTADPAAVRRMCETIKQWYGAGGSRIEGLVAAKGTAPDIAGKSIGKPSTSQKGHGGGR